MLVCARFLLDIPNSCFKFFSQHSALVYQTFFCIYSHAIIQVGTDDVSKHKHISSTVGSVFITFPCALPISSLCLNVLSAKIVSCRSKPSGLIRTALPNGLMLFSTTSAHEKASGAHDTLGTRRFD